MEERLYIGYGSGGGSLHNGEDGMAARPGSWQMVISITQKAIYSQNPHPVKYFPQQGSTF